MGGLLFAEYSIGYRLLILYSPLSLLKRAWTEGVEYDIRLPRLIESRIVTVDRRPRA
jgi:hypothetical protein